MPRLQNAFDSPKLMVSYVMSRMKPISYKLYIVSFKKFEWNHLSYEEKYNIEYL
jgi:hypothetical protein